MPALNLRTARCRFTEALVALITYATTQGYEIAVAPDAKHMPNSLHNSGLAIDLDLYLGGVYLMDTEDHTMLGTFWEDYGIEHGLPLVWGGNFKKPDGNHYSIRWQGVA